MPGRLLRLGFWKSAAWLYTVVVLIGLGILAFSVKTFVNEQHHSDEIAARTARLTSEVCRSQKLLRGVIIGIALNQPNLDARLVMILQQTLNQLPERCP